MPLRDPALTPESIRAAMAIPSTDRVRGLKDGVGFATTAEAMAAVYEASSLAPKWTLGPAPPAPWIGAICPHDDLRYAGRTYRRALAGISARTVVLVGTFHGWRKFEQGLGLFDGREAWFAPDGPVRVSPLREEVRSRLGTDFPVDDAAFDLEHSIEPIVAWLRHRNPELEILPILPPSDDPAPERIVDGPRRLGEALGAVLRTHGLELGRDVAVVVSADAIHYGADFRQTRYGEGPAAYEPAVAEDLRILRELLSGPIDKASAHALLTTFVDPADANRYRWTWCGRYAIPFGIRLLHALADGITAWPLAYETSISGPPLEVGTLGFTAPATDSHFVGYPAVAFTFASSSSA